MRRKSVVFLAILLLVSLTINLTGCTLCKIIARGNQPIVLNAMPVKHTVLGHFSKEKTFYFDYTKAPDISDIIREGIAEYPNVDAVTNVLVTVRTNFSDFFMNLITLGFANAYTMKVEGDAIQYVRKTQTN